MLVPLLLSICVLFISLMQSVNGAQFLFIIFLLFEATPVHVLLTVIVSLTSIYASL